MSFSLRSLAVVSSLCVAAPVMAQQSQSLQKASPSIEQSLAPRPVDARLLVSSEPNDERAKVAQDTAAAVAGPTVAVARLGVAPADAKPPRPMFAANHMGHGENVALMVVGGAAFLTGLIIGGDGGTAIAIGGAAVGLWGLYNYVK